MSTFLPEKTISSKVLAVTTFTGPELSLGGSSDFTTFSSLPACKLQLDCQLYFKDSHSARRYAKIGGGTERRGGRCQTYMCMHTLTFMASTCMQ